MLTVSAFVSTFFMGAIFGFFVCGIVADSNKDRGSA